MIPAWAARFRAGADGKMPGKTDLPAHHDTVAYLRASGKCRRIAPR